MSQGPPGTAGSSTSWERLGQTLRGPGGAGSWERLGQTLRGPGGAGPAHTLVLHLGPPELEENQTLLWKSLGLLQPSYVSLTYLNGGSASSPLNCGGYSLWFLLIYNNV